ncbi:MAG: hypothetical protein LBS09_10200 [Bacteroidales bacterium]|jgi:hypothetical protein|nr:hypothetical protein [Bacteroidales bacterium]
MIHSKKIIAGLFSMGLLFHVYAQEPILHEKSAYMDSLNRFYIQTEQPLYLYLSTTPNDAHPTPVSHSNSKTTKNAIEPMYLDGNGVHNLNHYDAHTNRRIVYSVYADGIAPVTKCDFNGDAALINKIQYYGKNVRMQLTAQDDMSGVAAVYYSINGASYQKYTADTEIHTQEGYNTLKYYAIDHVGNVEKMTEKTFSIDADAPVTYHTVTGIGANNVISPLSVIYLEPTDALSGVARTYYKFGDGDEQIYNGKFIPTRQLPEGDYTLYYYTVDKTGNKEALRSLKFYLDKSGPLVVSDILGDKFVVDDQVYFSGRTKMKLTSVDNKIGVKETKYSVNGLEYQTYTEPFYLPSKPGIHVIRYYAVDSLNNTTGSREAGNQEYTHIVNKIYVDLTGPSLSYKYKGLMFTTRDTTFISSSTEITLTGSDSESGLQKLTYTMDNNPSEITYTQPITISEGGTHKMNVIGYDNVNNRNIISIFFIVDNIAPSIHFAFSVDPIGTVGSENVYPPYVQLFIAPTDNLTGIDKITYAVNGQPAKDYQRYIDGFRENQENEVKITVTDKLGNMSEQTVRFHVKSKM